MTFSFSSSKSGVIVIVIAVTAIAMFFLHRQRNLLPVVENGKLLGIVSVWDVLARIGRVS